jgi:hypothetical protein
MQLGSMFISNCNKTLHVSDAICVYPQEHLKTVVTVSGVWHAARYKANINTNVPTYKIAKLLVKKLHEHLHLKYHYNVKDSIFLANDPTKLKINEHHWMITFDIKDLYVNILITETLTITKQLLSKHNKEQITTQILMLLESVLQQNYFSFQNNSYQPEKVVSMGSPISNTVAEIFLQYLENTYLSRNKSYSTLGTSMMY